MKIAKKKKKNWAKKWKKKLLLPVAYKHTQISLRIVLVIFIWFFTAVMFIANFQLQHSPTDIVQYTLEYDEALAAELYAMVEGYPIERMVPYIAQYDREVAAYLISIAKKESNWGKHSPVFGGRDCYNYWGFRLQTEVLGSGGHSCFKSSRQAVGLVADRMVELVKKEEKASPADMVVWKCGYGCSEHSSPSAQKWVKDVEYYYKQLVP